MTAVRLIVVVLGFIAFWNQAEAACPRPYIDGSYWVQGNVLCTCVKGYPVCKERVGHCDGWGDVHYHSFDRRKFNFQGVCRYILSRECCNNTFTIEVEQRPYSALTSVVDKFTIRFGIYVVNLASPSDLEVFLSGVGGTVLVGPGVLYDDTELRIEVIGGKILVTLKTIGIHFTWNWWYNVDVYAIYEHKGTLCGLCADFNDDPSNDLDLTPFDEEVSTIPQWGESWKVAEHHQPKRCCHSSTGGDPHDDCEQHAAEMNKCDILLNGPIFAGCHSAVNPKPFIDDCHLEMCECAKAKREDCLCVGASGYIAACEAAGVFISDGWKKEHNCGVCKDENTGVVYEHGATWTYKCFTRTCRNGHIVEKKDPKCCQFGEKFYLNGQSWTINCYKYTCRDGKISKVLHPKCCIFRGRTYTNGQTWTYNCHSYTCNSGKIVAVPKCCIYNRRTYSFGTWFWGGVCLRCYCPTSGRVFCRKYSIKCQKGYKVAFPCRCVPILSFNVGAQ